MSVGNKSGLYWPVLLASVALSSCGQVGVETQPARSAEPADGASGETQYCEDFAVELPEDEALAVSRDEAIDEFLFSNSVLSGLQVEGNRLLRDAEQIGIIQVVQTERGYYVGSAEWCL